MKLPLKKWRMPKTHTWYFWLFVKRKDKKTGNPIHVVYSISTPTTSYNTYITLLPTLELETHRPVVENSGPAFELRLNWLKFNIRLLSRDVWWGDDEDETADPLEV